MDMDSATAAALDRITRDFYRTVAPEFSASRERLNEGIVRAFTGLPSPSSVLDLGCGDGRVGLAWAAGQLPVAWSAGCRYVGVDQSGALLGARAPWPRGLEPVEGDLAGPWPKGPFDVVCCFAALHHVAGRRFRRELMERIGRTVAPGGTWAISVWRFLHLERYRARLVEWERVGVDPAALEPGDVLLDWRRGPAALRYVHHYDRVELEEDLEGAGLGPAEIWAGDGGLGLYARGRSRA